MSASLGKYSLLFILLLAFEIKAFESNSKIYSSFVASQPFKAVSLRAVSDSDRIVLGISQDNSENFICRLDGAQEACTVLQKPPADFNPLKVTNIRDDSQPTNESPVLASILVNNNSVASLTLSAAKNSSALTVLEASNHSNIVFEYDLQQADNKLFRMPSYNYLLSGGCGHKVTVFETTTWQKAYELQLQGEGCVRDFVKLSEHKVLVRFFDERLEESYMNTINFKGEISSVSSKINHNAEGLHFESLVQLDQEWYVGLQSRSHVWVYDLFENLKTPGVIIPRNGEKIVAALYNSRAQSMVVATDGGVEIWKIGGFARHWTSIERLEDISEEVGIALLVFISLAAVGLIYLIFSYRRREKGGEKSSEQIMMPMLDPKEYV
jgi:hypothetical protein